MEQDNNSSIKNLSYIRSKILTLNDVVDFCQKEGEFMYFIFRPILPTNKMLYSRIFFSSNVTTKKGNLILTFLVTNIKGTLQC